MYKCHGLGVVFLMFFYFIISNENMTISICVCGCDGRSTFFFLDKALSNACIYQNNLLHNNLQL